MAGHLEERGRNSLGLAKGRQENNENSVHGGDREEDDFTSSGMPADQVPARSRPVVLPGVLSMPALVLEDPLYMSQKARPRHIMNRGPGVCLRRASGIASATEQFVA